MTQPVARRALFGCDGAAIPAAVRAEHWDVAGEISARGNDPELTLILESLAGNVVGEVDPIARDLIRVAAHCYAADLRVPRGGIDVHRERWRREMVLYITVADPTFWSDSDVTGRLVEALGFATEDTWSFVFQQEPAEEAQLPIRWDGREVLGQPGAVVLFSSGIDSLCALVEAQPFRPIVVSHWSARQIKARQGRLLAAVEHLFGGRDFPHARFEIHRIGSDRAESSQRSRGFLYACLGAAIAAHHGIAEVHLADNGYVSVNPPISDQLVGALASRGTHPKFLHLMNRLLERVFPAGVQVVNPLWNRTRAEALNILVEAKCPELLVQTYSCGKQQGHPAGKHLCGGCSQCVDRRIAVIATGLEQHDPLDRYERDLFSDELREGEARTIALAYVRFADQIAALDAADIVERFPQMDDCIAPDNPEFWTKTNGIADMLKRHAEETMRVMEVMIARKSRDLARRRLPKHALLPLWINERGTAPTNAGIPQPYPQEPVMRYGVHVDPPGLSFIRTGTVWVVEFRDEKGHYKHSRGMTQLAHLLENPKQRLDIVALARCEAAPAPAGLSADGWSAGIGGGLGDLVDAKGIERLEHHLTTLPAAIQAARAAGRADEVARLREDQRLVKRQLRVARGLGGRLRQMGGPEEKARKAVSKNVHACYALFAEKLPRFLDHAKRFVHLGIPPCYNLDPPERWTVRR
ncbi:MAG: hypothetical protein ACRDJW_22830 [Thermomicrobiales bacterium]